MHYLLFAWKMHKGSLNNNSLIRLVKFETVFTIFDVCLGFKSVATTEMVESIKICNIKITIRTDHCTFIITVDSMVPWSAKCINLINIWII